MKWHSQNQDESRKHSPGPLDAVPTPTLQPSHRLIRKREPIREQTHRTQTDCDQAEGRDPMERLEFLRATFQKLTAYLFTFQDLPGEK